jgi:hypothetical protein
VAVEALLIAEIAEIDLQRDSFRTPYGGKLTWQQFRQAVEHALESSVSVNP